MKLYCAYDHSTPKQEIANHKCDICGALMCKICGFHEEEKDYCNECWQEKEMKESIIEIADPEGWWNYNCGNCGKSLSPDTKQKGKICPYCFIEFKGIVRV